MAKAKLLDKIKPESQGQKTLLEALLDTNKEIVGVFGPTGTGKSLLSVITGLSLVQEGKYERLVISKPVESLRSTDNSGSRYDIDAYRRIVIDYLKDLVVSVDPESTRIIDEFVSSEKIIIASPYHIRGRSFDSAYVVLDDVQNLDPEIIVEVITRLGRSSKLVIAGDPVFQAHNPQNGAVLARNILKGEESGAVVVDLGLNDIVRPGARRGVRLLIELLMRKRALDDIESRIIDSFRIHAPDADIITVVNLIDAKKTYGIDQEHVPDALVIVKPGHLGRTIGTQGKRIESVEEDTGLNLRAVELSLDFKVYFRAIHPVSWIHKHILRTDIAGSDIVVVVKKGELGPMVGQKGYYAKFMEYFFRKVFNSGLIIYESEDEAKPGKKRRKK
ncbi:MAG: PhoH family protein [Desulfurococcales archaeon]|nr:PhoH family protein [Desulfurococcales archaeon]